MLAEELVHLITETIRNVPSGSPERDYQGDLVDMLRSRGYNAGPFRPQAGGVADILIERGETRILIELKPSGDWRHAGEAAVQLWSYAVELPADTVKVAVFGGPLTNEVHRKLLDRLDIHSIFRPE
jgi:hypothetical protein